MLKDALARHTELQDPKHPNLSSQRVRKQLGAEGTAADTEC